MSGKDQYEKYELGLPFARTKADVFHATLWKCHQDCGNEGYVTIESLVNNFTSQVWASQLKSSESRLVKTLLHAHFKNESKGQEADQIDFEYLMIFGFLHCAGKPQDKVEVLFNIL